MRKNTSTALVLIAMLCSFGASLYAQTPAVLFQHGFENSLVGAPPGTNDPTVGSYVLTQIVSNNLEVLTGPDPNGPAAAAEGTKYLRYDMVRVGNTGGASPFVNALFSSGVWASKTPLHVSFYKYRPNLGGYPQMILGNSAAGPSTALHLVYSTAWPTNLFWRWYNGSAYIDSGLVFGTGKWEFVEIDWDGTNVTGRIDNGTPTALGIMGTGEKIVDRLLFRNGNNFTYFYLDDIKITTTAPIIERSLLPAPNSTGVSRRPLIRLELANGTRSVRTNNIQLLVNNQPVVPSITQTTTGGVTITSIAYTPSTSRCGRTNR